MDAVRDRSTRCLRCQYYVCVCEDITRNGSADKSIWPINQVEIISRKRKVETSDFKFGKCIRVGPWFVERIARLQNSNKLFVVRNLETTLRFKENVEREVSILSRLCTMHESKWLQRLLLHFEEQDRSGAPTSVLVLEYNKGGPLSEIVSERGALTTDEVKFYGAQVYLGLEFLHQNHIAHRDIRSENVIVQSSGVCKLANFGFVVHLGPGERTKTFTGNAHYMAPEIYRHIIQNEQVFDGYTKDVDWWSFGILLYELIQGIPLYASLDPASVLDKLGSLSPDAAVDVEKVRKCVDLRAWDLIHHLVCLDVGKRSMAAKNIRKHEFFKYYQHEKLQWDKVHLLTPPNQPPQEDFFPAKAYFLPKSRPH